jgi:hypothetical protein
MGCRFLSQYAAALEAAETLAITWLMFGSQVEERDLSG